jgi:SsrA-binding protein
LHKREISRLIGLIHEQGLTMVPLKVYTKDSLLKLEFAVAKGKKSPDKRAVIKKREIERSLRRLQARS